MAPAGAAIGSDQANSPFCQAYRSYVEKFSAVLVASADATKLKAASADANAAIGKAVSTAPTAIKADVQILATTVRDFLAALEKNNFDIAKVRDQAATLAAKPFGDAFANTNTYVLAHCAVR